MNPLCFVDTETTGLDPRIHQPYEVCWWREDAPDPEVIDLPHDLAHADAGALAIGGYYARGMGPFPDTSGYAARRLIHQLRDVTIVGCNPAFDVAMLTRVVGAPVWHHRLIDVAQGAMWVFDWDRPKGLADIRAALLARGHDQIPEPDHTAEGDVRTTRAVYYALLAERSLLK